MIKEKFGDRLDDLVRALFPFLFWRPLNPNLLSLLGALVSVGAASAFLAGDLRTGGWLMIASGFFDLVDGAVARHNGTASTFGAFLDSTLDRVSEGALYAGLAYFYFTRTRTATVWMRGMFEGSAEWGDADGPTLGVLALAVLILSFLVSYARARAEGLGLECKVGIMERPERVLTLGAGALLGHRFMPGALGILFVLTLVTVLQRVYHVRKVTRTDSA